MDTLSSVFSSVVVRYIVYIILTAFGLSEEKRNDFWDTFQNLFDKILGTMSLWLEKIYGEVEPIPSKTLIDHAVIQQAFKDAFQRIDDGLKNTTSTLDEHYSSLARKIEPNDEYRSWKIFGYLIQLGFLAVFVFADVIQSINNLSLIFPQDIPKAVLENYPLLKNLTLSLIVSSVGTAIAMSFIIADFAGISHFGRWSELQGKTKYIVVSLTWFTLILSVAIAVTLGLNRIPAIPQIAPFLSPEFVRNINIAAGFAQAIVVFPLFITTFLFFGGLVAIAILYILGTWLISTLVKIVHLLLLGIIHFVFVGLARIIDLIIRGIIWLISLILLLLAWVFAAANAAGFNVLEVVQKLLNVVYFPIDKIIEFLVKIIAKIINKSNDSKSE